MRLQLLAGPGLKVAEDAGEDHGAGVVGVDVGLEHIGIAGLEWAGGAAPLVSVAVDHVSVETGPRPKQLPTDLASELLLLVIPADVAEEIFLVMGCEVTLRTGEYL